ncbi:MAG: histidine kinase [Bdellovibrionales bacterium RIFCSPHIGHO2_01_FULL_40_29]|nr:MAG: histidine kinase [Bdellovibrionales bacterium RIFCSPHIGHO2_01_FULL_40_29]OFZ32850.1 MAG: histidine kinase [Bdellovibrionales bacterium RIFCSPHIGHO2_02_FULL_40_15]
MKQTSSSHPEEKSGLSSLSWRQLAIRIVFAVIASSLISFLKLDYIESYFYDLRVSLKAVVGLSHLNTPPIVLIKIDTKTVESFQGFPNYQQHSDFLNQLTKGQPRFVIYDFRPKDGELKDIEGDELQRKTFALVAGQIPNFYIPTDDLEMKGEAGKLKLNSPLEQLKIYPGIKTSDTILFAKDGVYRRMMVRYQEQKLLHPIVAESFNPKIQNTSAIRGLFSFFDSDQAYINYHPNGSFPSYSFEDILKGNIDNNTFRDKIVIVGTDTGKSAKEYALTPYSREINAMTSIEVHANMIQTLIDNNAPIRLPNWVNILFTCLISVLTVHVVLSLKPSRGLLLLGSTLLGFITLAFLLFIIAGIWIDIAHPFLTIFLCYYFFIPYRLIIENRRSWEYFQKNKLLKQVEELKTNFISMMSHDLKTPIARILGMADVILKEDVVLSSMQREAVDTIKVSSNDLLKFINAILQYGSIESQGVELHRQSKDINQLILDVIKKHEFLAQVKKIKIVQELEPLFPILVDPELIKQVFSNLIENSIKYSPEGSSVVVRTRESGNEVQVDIIDQGMGIPTADLPNIFMKFFRTHSVKTSTIKGSGLGLYLASYFVELHKGQITVVSEPNQGSQFTVSLPLQN